MRSTQLTQLTVFCAGLLLLSNFIAFQRERISSADTLTSAEQFAEPECTDEGLFAWAKNQGARIDKIGLGEFAFEAEAEPGNDWIQRLRTRRGMRAKRNIRKGEVILEIPFNLTFSVCKKACLLVPT